MWVDFNINHNVRVKLTITGIEALKKYHDDLWRNSGKNYPYIPPDQDADGWSKWQLWDLMNQLGSGLFLGCTPPFQTAIQIELPDTSSTTHPEK